MLKHSQKVKLARRLRTQEELLKGISIFDTKAWNERKEAIARRVKRQQRGKEQ